MGAAETAASCVGKARAAAAAAADVCVLQQMEAQLQHLSSTVRSHQAEREQLRQAMMAGVSERQALQEQVQVLSAKLKQLGAQ